MVKASSPTGHDFVGSCLLHSHCHRIDSSTFDGVAGLGFNKNKWMFASSYECTNYYSDFFLAADRKSGRTRPFFRLSFSRSS